MGSKSKVCAKDNGSMRARRDERSGSVGKRVSTRVGELRSAKGLLLAIEEREDGRWHARRLQRR